MSIVTIHGPNTMYDPEVHVVTRGTPGTFNTGQEIPGNLTEMNAEVKPSDLSRWVNGQYVVLGDASETYWNGTTWIVGRAPSFPITGATAGTPGAFTPSPYYADALPANLAALQALNPTGGSAWTTGQYVLLGDASHANWTGSAWAAGNHA